MLRYSIYLVTSVTSIIHIVTELSSDLQNSQRVIKLIQMHSFPEFLTKKYLDWQATIGERKTLDEFAIYLGISRPLLSMWLNGTRRPGIKNIELLAELFGVDVYDALDLPRPDPFVAYVQGTSERLKDNQKKKIAEQIAKYITANEKESPPS